MIQRAMGFPESSISGTLVVCPVAYQRGGGAAGGRPLERLRESDVICRPTTFLETTPLMMLPTAACTKNIKNIDCALNSSFTSIHYFSHNSLLIPQVRNFDQSTSDFLQTHNFNSPKHRQHDRRQPRVSDDPPPQSCPLECASYTTEHRC